MADALWDAYPIKGISCQIEPRNLRSPRLDSLQPIQMAKAILWHRMMPSNHLAMERRRLEPQQLLHFPPSQLQ
jgi:hypothetical protein